MLKQRILTALALLAVLLPALFADSMLPFRVVSLLLIAVAAWEWVRLNGYGLHSAWLAGLASGLLCLGYWTTGLLDISVPAIWLVSGLVWLMGGSITLYLGVPSWLKCPQSLRATTGVAAIFVAWVAVVQARALGINFLLSVLALVWMADIAAYFVGRALGGRVFKRKLAPSISPGKSWEGVGGGVLGVLALSWVWMTLETAYSLGSASIYSRLADHGIFFFLISLCILCGLSVMGDLFESLVKRSAGVKDSSRLLPGHGGVLDRIDALLPTLPAAMFLCSLSQGS